MTIGNEKGRFALIICPESPGDRRLLGLTVGERLLLTLDAAGFKRAYLAGPGPRPRSDRIEMEIRDAADLDHEKIGADILILPADLVLDGALLDDLKQIPDHLPLRLSSPRSAARAAERPRAFLNALPRGSDSGPGFALRVRDPIAARRAERALLLALRKPKDGPVSRRINRPISLQITRRLSRLGANPHWVTVFTTLVGLAAAALAAVGSPAWILAAAAFLFQAQSILDGVDGELARLNHRASVAGQWLDSIGDHLTEFLFCLGLAVGQARSLGWTWLYWPAFAVLFMQAVCAFLFYRRMIRMGVGDMMLIPDMVTQCPSPGLAGRALGAVKFLGKRDVYILLVAVLTALQLPLVGFCLMAAGTIPWFLGTVANEVKLKSRTLALYGPAKTSKDWTAGGTSHKSSTPRTARTCR